MKADYRIRPVRPDETARLVQIEWDADRLFLDCGVAEAIAMAEGPPTPLADFQAMLDACRTVVAATPADDRAVGFAAILPLDGDCWLRLLAVDPDHGRRGIGSALVRETLEHGRRTGASRCGLSTFRDIAFNQPYYEALGFLEVPLADAPDALRHRFEAEIPPPARPEQRVLMAIDL